MAMREALWSPQMRKWVNDGPRLAVRVSIPWEATSRTQVVTGTTRPTRWIDPNYKKIRELDFDQILVRKVDIPLAYRKRFVACLPRAIDGWVAISSLDALPPALKEWLIHCKARLIRARGWEGGGTAVVTPTGTPANAYVTEDGVTFYVAEDGSTFYVQET